MAMKGGTEGEGSAISSSLRGCLLPAIADLMREQLEIERRAEFEVLEPLGSEHCLTEVSPLPLAGNAT